MPIVQPLDQALNIVEFLGEMSFTAVTEMGCDRSIG